MHPTIELALMKIGWDVPITSDEGKNILLAALDSRVLLQFDPYNSRQEQSEMVRSYMRCVFVIPASREYIWSGFPSEPMISGAAARLLNGADLKSRTITHVAPNTLVDALNNGLIARGERGETVARLLLTIAHDLEVIRKNPELKYGSHFHQPVCFLNLLEDLLSAEVWKKVRAAKPVHEYPGNKILAEAFLGSYVNFSHFVRLGNHESFGVGFGFELLKRGAAMQAYDNQENQDIGIPIHFGGLNTEIKVENMSIFKLQIKNTKEPAKTFPKPGLAGPIDKCRPIICIVMQLGAAKHAEKERVVVHTVKRETGYTSSSNDDIQTRHYEITVYGCTSATYGCIPDTESATYASLLMSREPFEDAPRAKPESKDNLDACYALKPMMYKSVPVNCSWTR